MSDRPTSITGVHEAHAAFFALQPFIPSDAYNTVGFNTYHPYGLQLGPVRGLRALLATVGVESTVRWALVGKKPRRVVEVTSVAPEGVPAAEALRTAWRLFRAPVYRLPEGQRERIVRHVDGPATYARDADAGVVSMDPDHYIVWPRSATVAGRLEGDGSPAYIGASIFEATFGRPATSSATPGAPPLGAGLMAAEKLNGIRAAVYDGSGDAHMLTDENDPQNEATWAMVHPGDRVALAVDKDGRPLLYDKAGVRRLNIYPIGRDTWAQLPYRTDVAGADRVTTTGPLAPIMGMRTPPLPDML